MTSSTARIIGSLRSRTSLTKLRTEVLKYVKIRTSGEKSHETELEPLQIPGPGPRRGHWSWRDGLGPGAGEELLLYAGLALGQLRRGLAGPDPTDAGPVSPEGQGARFPARRAAAQPPAPHP